MDGPGLRTAGRLALGEDERNASEALVEEPVLRMAGMAGTEGAPAGTRRRYGT